MGGFWRAVGAIEGLVDKAAFILEPRACAIHAAASHELLGSASEDGYIWHEDVMKRVFPDVAMAELRRASFARRA